ncbi:Pirna Biogenesis Protein Exd1 [Manis pentadactyla]|nr:Pirna Biogenesis Protein Exd1 [Manis pentadactyla]
MDTGGCQELNRSSCHGNVPALPECLNLTIPKKSLISWLAYGAFIREHGTRCWNTLDELEDVFLLSTEPVTSQGWDADIHLI